MARSSEYPDLTWISPASWTSGRPSGQPSLIVIHTTEGSEGTTSAENGALYDARRTDGTSTHYFHDQDTTVQCVRTWDTAHTAGYTGNRKGIQHELCGRAGQSSSQWLDAASEGTIRQAAKQCARDAKKYGIPVRKLSVAEVRAGARGFCGHADISYAWGEVDHTDPGPTFPWNRFLNLVNQYLNPAPPTVELEGEEEMISNSHPIPHGFAYDENGAAIAREHAISVGVEPAGLAANPVFGKKRLYLSLTTDHTDGNAPVRVRVAINDGAGFAKIKIYDVTPGGRVSVEVPAPANGAAFNVVAGRVKSTADAEEWEILVPLSLTVTVA